MDPSWQYKLAELFQSTSFSGAVTVLDCQSIPSMEVGLVDWPWLVVRSMTSRPLSSGPAPSRILNTPWRRGTANSVAGKQAVWRVSSKSFWLKSGGVARWVRAVSGRQWRQRAATLPPSRTWSRPGCCSAACRSSRRPSSPDHATPSTRSSGLALSPRGRQSQAERSPAVSNDTIPTI